MADAMAEARKKMIEKRFGGNTSGASTGGSGATRRKAKTTYKAVGDDKKLAQSFKKMNLQPITGIEEVNMFMDNDEVLHIAQPKLQASMPSKMFVISGQAEKKHVYELMPGIMNQLSQEQIVKLQKIAQMYGQQNQAAEAGAEATIPEGDEDDEDEIPELVENFEDASKK